MGRPIAGGVHNSGHTRTDSGLDGGGMDEAAENWRRLAAVGRGMWSGLRWRGMFTGCDG